MNRSQDGRANEYAGLFDGQSPGTLFVTDARGNILISNEFTALTIGIPLEELLKYNVQDLVRAGYYSDSVTMKAIGGKKKVSMVIRTVQGFNVMSTATPILNQEGEVQLVVTSSNSYPGEAVREETSPPPYPNARPRRGGIRPDPEMTAGIVAESLAMKQIIQVCNQIASYDSKVLILGESGTGKEIIAKYIHRKSSRWNGPFIPVNCAAIPADSFEYELFGRERRAAEPSDDKKGLVELAAGGVLFLDEIAEMPLDMQAKLLHVLESSELRRIGGTAPVPVCCRVICATNRDLWSMVQQGQFREDLYYRINVIPIHIPPLRSRKPDLVGLTSSFIAYFNAAYGKRYVLGADEFQRILDKPWHGNARELRNYIERLVITGNVQADERTSEEGLNDAFALDHFIFRNRERAGSLKDFAAIAEGRFIKQMLAECGGNAAEAAKRLGVDRSVIYRKLKKLEDVLGGPQGL
ncbi:sigma 54-interacting transcriptional regulator [Paenibacillus sp. MMS20-IR301]|uniref:sigma-54 interaction domain-containing protein n=1 Tax=Paenibacillus sp. MMS20-IR301 TaxID=2895946 RepID=UPI0028E8FBF6|nr:sigma 54-interacting transcriptional regulator [Paenibacillus sp. MMS20-IR301]WNS41393.1 sigma 54-interacting transcriptional regulator [Paenibacillus sp. MMS20-IR301]